MAAMRQTILQKIYRHPFLFIFSVAGLILLLVCMPSFDVDTVDRDGRTALHRAAEQGDLDETKSLLERGASVDARDHCRWTPMMRAAQKGHLTVVELLLETGADLNARDKDGYNALAASVISNRPRVFEYLLRKGIEMDVQDHTVGWTPLIWAVKLERRTMIQTLLDKGADSGIRGLDGLIAADWAKKNGNLSLARQLHDSH